VLHLPEVAESAEVIPFVIDATKMENVEELLVLSDASSPTQIVRVRLKKGAAPYVATSFRVRHTDRLVTFDAIARLRDGRLLRARREIRVTLGSYEH